MFETKQTEEGKLDVNDSSGGNNFLDQARQGQNSFWRYLVALIFIIALNIAVTTLLLGLAIYYYGTVDLRAMPEWFVLIVGMLPFGFSAVALWVSVVLIHKRPFQTLLTSFKSFRWRLLLISGAAWIGLSVLSDLIMVVLRPGNLYWSFDPTRFLPFLLVAVVLIPIQAGTEELLFRGYLTQAFGLLGRGIWLAWIVPALLFGLLHGVNPEIEAFGFRTMMVYYIGMGLFLGWITLKSGGLELALGLHIANNLYASLMVTFPDSAIPSPAIFSVREFDPFSGVIVFFLMVGTYTLFIFGMKVKYVLVIAGLIGLFLLTAGIPPATH
jgi:uncharacterized protein